MESVHLPRFRRAPITASIRLTERDRDILKHVHKHRFLRSDHLAALVPGSPQRILRRLQLLYHHGYLERPRCQIDYYHRSGSRSIAYGLDNKGAAFLKRQLSLPFHRLDWPRQNKITRIFLEHALLISDVMVAIELACRKRGIRLLTEGDLEFRTTRKPFQWKVEIGRNRVCGIIPDRVFGLEFSGRLPIWFCLEADRGTMPVIRRDFSQSSFHRKMLAYQATWKQNLHQKLFGCPRFRVLAVTNIPGRVTTLLDDCRSLESGQGLFLFSRIDALMEDVFKWQTCHGLPASLLD